MAVAFPVGCGHVGCLKAFCGTGDCKKCWRELMVHACMEGEYDEYFTDDNDDRAFE